MGDDGETHTPEKKEAEKKVISSPLIEKAGENAAAMKVENDRRDALLSREEQLIAEKKLGGETEAGQAPEKKEEESDQAYAQRAIEGKLNAKEAT